jgi:hypothetical protein
MVRLLSHYLSVVDVQTFRPLDLPTFRPSNLPTFRPSDLPTILNDRFPFRPRAHHPSLQHRHRRRARPRKHHSGFPCRRVNHCRLRLHDLRRGADLQLDSSARRQAPLHPQLTPGHADAQHFRVVLRARRVRHPRRRAKIVPRRPPLLSFHKPHLQVTGFYVSAPPFPKEYSKPVSSFNNSFLVNLIRNRSWTQQHPHESIRVSV